MPIVYASSIMAVKARSNFLSHNRFGAVISTSVDSRAVRRHVLKRVLLAHVRQWKGLPSDFVFILSRPAARLSRQEFRAELDHVREKVFALTPKP